MKFADYKYEHLDEQYLKQNYEDYLAKLKECNEPDSLMKVFKEFNIFRGHVSSMQTICSVRHTINTADEFYDKENEYWDTISPSMQTYEVELAKTLLECEFKDKLGIPETYFKLAEYSLKGFAPEIIEDMQEENKLVSEYGKLKASAKIEFEGQTYNLASIGPKMMDDDRQLRKKAYTAFTNFYEENEEKFDEIYDKLVKVRDKMAKKLGYENFIKLGYIRMNRLDYDEKMVENYRNQVIKEIVPIAVKLRQKQASRIGINDFKCYDKAYKFKTGNPKPQGDIDDLSKAALKMYTQMSPETAEFFKTMVDQELYDLPTRPNKEMGGYTTGIYDYRVPFIFANSNGTTGDVDTLTHEAGHAFQAYLSMKNVDIPDLCWPTLETCEIHSMSMEFFAHPWSELFFGKDTNKYYYSHIADCLEFLPYGCLVDHFQHEVYANPDMTPAQRKACWAKLEKIYLPDTDYEGFGVLERGGFYYRQGHIFQSPFYYIDYTLAQVCALQFYVRSLNKDPNAWNDYLKICSIGGTKSFVEVVRMANLKVPFEDGCLHEVAKTMEQELDKIDDSEL